MQGREPPGTEEEAAEGFVTPALRPSHLARRRCLAGSLPSVPHAWTATRLQDQAGGAAAPASERQTPVWLEMTTLCLSPWFRPGSS